LTSLVRDRLEAAGGLLAAALRDGRDAEPSPDGTAPHPARLASSGPRVRGCRREIELAVAAVYEGYLLHYGTGRIVDADDDPDLALLAGDRLYALGLAQLAELDDLQAVAELADVIGLCAQAHASQDADLAAAVWEAGAVGVGWGPRPELAAAKMEARQGRPDAARALRAAARHARGQSA
jgi:hypothetical protein